MHASVRAGGMAGAFFATSVGAQRPLGVEGWRFAFFTVAGISVFSGIVTLAFASDPRKVCFSPLSIGRLLDLAIPANYHSNLRHTPHNLRHTLHKP